MANIHKKKTEYSALKQYAFKMIKIGQGKENVLQEMLIIERAAVILACDVSEAPKCQLKF